MRCLWIMDGEQMMDRAEAMTIALRRATDDKELVELLMDHGLPKCRADTISAAILAHNYGMEAPVVKDRVIITFKDGYMRVIGTFDKVEAPLWGDKHIGDGRYWVIRIEEPIHFKYDGS